MLKPIIFSIILFLSISLKAKDTTRTKVDTISKQVINIYLAKGLEARKLVLVLRERIQLDSQIISTKDTIIKQYQLVDREWSSKYKQKEEELKKSVERENKEYFWKRVFQVTTIFFAGLFLAN